MIPPHIQPFPCPTDVSPHPGRIWWCCKEIIYWVSKCRFAPYYKSYYSYAVSRLSYVASWWTSHTFLQGVRDLLHCRHEPRWGSVNLAAYFPALSDWLRLRQKYDWHLVPDHHIFSSIWPRWQDMGLLWNGPLFNWLLMQLYNLSAVLYLVSLNILL